MGNVIAVWFSCGLASAVSAKLALDIYGHKNVRILNNPIKEEHPDNVRFRNDCEKFFNHEIELVFNPEYPIGSCVDVWNKGYMSGPSGAACTLQLKKRARQLWERQNFFTHLVLGFTLEEKKRHNDFILNERDNLLPLLINAGYTKQDCANIVINEWGIKPPEIYSYGFPNANCIGCVKASSPTYWNHVRKIFPEIFNERAIQSEKIGCRLVRYEGKRIFLRELPLDAKGKPMSEINVSCGIFCSGS